MLNHKKANFVLLTLLVVTNVSLSKNEFSITNEELEATKFSELYKFIQKLKNINKSNGDLYLSGAFQPEDCEAKSDMIIENQKLACSMKADGYYTSLKEAIPKAVSKDPTMIYVFNYQKKLTEEYFKEQKNNNEQLENYIITIFIIRIDDTQTIYCHVFASLFLSTIVCSTSTSVSAEGEFVAIEFNSYVSKKAVDFEPQIILKVKINDNSYDFLDPNNRKQKLISFNVNLFKEKLNVDSFHENLLTTVYDNTHSKIEPAVVVTGRMPAFIENDEKPSAICKFFNGIFNCSSITEKVSHSEKLRSFFDDLEDHTSFKKLQYGPTNNEFIAFYSTFIDFKLKGETQLEYNQKTGAIIVQREGAKQQQILI